MGRFTQALRHRATSVARSTGVSRRGLSFSQSQLDVLSEQSFRLQSALDQVNDELKTIRASTGPQAQASANILDEYCGEVPSPQTAADVFLGEWAGSWPEPFADVRVGHIDLHGPAHVDWGVTSLGGVSGSRVLEIGPLEGGHTYFLDRKGASEVVAVEANTRAYLKCLVFKEVVGIPSARFECGDALLYVERMITDGSPKFDLCLASGVLYHFTDPVRALDLLCRTSDRLVLWTHYYDEKYIRARPHLDIRFRGSTQQEHAGYRHTLHRHEYQDSLQEDGFCGGSAATSAWLSRAELLGAIEHFGFEIVDTGFEELDNPNGPCLAIAAKRIGVS